ncbi:MAG TPA: class I SAM-dependent methyltransferase [Chlamydiales bacterium]|nr:class I SAM-dependent methyltransferase [Chlamydiales bacterium]
MQHKFALFNSHIDLSHALWKKLILPGDIAVDATAGNGHDSLYLATLPLQKLFIFDIQKEAIAATRKRLKDVSIPLLFHECCHSKLDEVIQERSIKLVVYNLGYLPGSDKQIKTGSKTTLQSIQVAMRLLVPGGCICITCYPGHVEGAHEEAQLIEVSSLLSPAEWCVSWHRFQNRKESPSLLILQKSENF